MPPVQLPLSPALLCSQVIPPLTLHAVGHTSHTTCRLSHLTSHTAYRWEYCLLFSENTSLYHLYIISVSPFLWNFSQFFFSPRPNLTAGYFLLCVPMGLYALWCKRVCVMFLISLSLANYTSSSRIGVGLYIHIIRGVVG